MSSRRVLITGAGRGLGQRLAYHLAAQGDRVWGTIRRGDPDPWLAGALRFDVADESAVAAEFDRLAAEVDGLDLVINNAGVDARAFGANATARGPFDLSAAIFSQVLAVNVTGPMVVTKAALDLLDRGDNPVVVNISSQLGSFALAPGAGRDAAYNTSKAALNMWGANAAAELSGRGVTMIMLHPGWVQTDMGGPRATLTEDDSALAIIDTIAAITPADAGRFLTWDGRDHPW